MAARIVKQNINSPDEVREFSHGLMRVLQLGPETLGYGVFNPGWRWSTDVKPRVGGESCQVTHGLYVLSGRMQIKHDDGSQLELGPGDAAYLAPGHDAWVTGNEPCVALDWTGARTYAKPR
jgi:mannose-6-phosphate isomerase-like protein (cupin superfamily)